MTVPLPSEYKCPLTHTIMTDPVNLGCHKTHNFEKSEIHKWIDKGNSTCPLDRSQVVLKSISYNSDLAKSIRSFVKDNPIFCPQGIKETDSCLQIFQNTHLNKADAPPERRPLEITLNLSRERPNILINNVAYDIPTSSFSVDLDSEGLNVPGADSIHISITRDEDEIEEENFPDNSGILDSLVNHVFSLVQRLARIIGL